MHAFPDLIRSVALLAAIAPLAAQTTGVAGINDYTVNGVAPGSSSCPQVCIPTPGIITMNVNTVPGAFVVIVFTDCPCRGCAIPWAANACTPAIPNGIFPACSTTNQSIDFFPIPGCNVIWSGTAIATAAGQATILLPVPLIAIGTVPCSTFQMISTQAIVFDPCGLGGVPIGPGPFVLTQAYDVTF